MRRVKVKNRFGAEVSLSEMVLGRDDPEPLTYTMIRKIDPYWQNFRKKKVASVYTLAEESPPLPP